MPTNVFKPVTDNWNVAADWSDGAVPGAFQPYEDAAFSAGSIVTVTDLQHVGRVAAGSVAPSITIASGGTLLLGGGAASSGTGLPDGTFEMSSGTLTLAGVLGSGTGTTGFLNLDGGSLMAQGGTLRHIQVQGTLDLSASGAALVGDQLTVVSPKVGTPGSILLTGTNATLEIATTETLSNEAIALGNTAANSPSVLTVDAGAVLTLASSTVTLTSQGGAAINGAGKLVLLAGSSIVDNNTSNPGPVNLTIATAGGFENDGTVGSGYNTVISSAITGTGTLNFTGFSSLTLGSTVSATQTVAFKASNETLTLNAVSALAPTAVAANITGLATSGINGEIVDFTSLSFTNTLVGSVQGGQLRIVDGTTLDAVLNTPDLADGTYVGLSALVSGGTQAVVACYCPGTRIGTPDGETAIEALAVGDLVTSVDGSALPVRWIGRRSYGGRFLAGRPALWPIRIAAGALGNGRPHRDLLVSPNHAMLIDGVLVAAELLVNGTNVTRVVAPSMVEYVHVELDRHDAVWAEGVASETYVDDGTRGMFLSAEGGAVSGGAVQYCAPRVESGAVLAAIRARIGSGLVADAA